MPTETLERIETARREGAERLNLSGCQLTTVPPEVFRLTKLRELALSNNELQSLPTEIGQLSDLRAVYLVGNQLTSLPPGMFRLTNLTELNLAANQLTSLPPEIGQLRNLRELQVWDNQLSAVPTEIGQLTRLQELNLTTNRLTSLPPEICRLPNLQELRVADNQLISLPSEIGQLTNLREFVFPGNRLTSLPPEIGQLINLREVYLAHNQLASLPPEIGRLTNLRGLYLFNNELTSLPSEISELTNLRGLDVRGNPLPEAIVRELVRSHDFNIMVGALEPTRTSIMSDGPTPALTSVPVIVDDVKDLPGFSMVRCDYFTIEGSDPPMSWVLGLRRRQVPFLMLGLSGVICHPSAECPDFQRPKDIDDLANAIEEREGLSIESEFTWLPVELCRGAKVKLAVRRGDVFRLGIELFSLAHKFRLNRLPQDEFEHGALSLQRQITYSPRETEVFAAWSEQQISEARERYVAMSLEGNALPWSNDKGPQGRRGKGTL